MSFVESYKSMLLFSKTCNGDAPNEIVCKTNKLLSFGFTIFFSGHIRKTQTTTNDTVNALHMYTQGCIDTTGETFVIAVT